MPVFQCYVLPYPTVGQTGIFLHNPQFFNTSSYSERSTSLLTKISLDRYLASKRILSTLEISTQLQVVRKTQPGRVLPQIIWCLGKCAHCKGVNYSSKSIQVIEWYVCVCTRSPRLFYQYRTLLRLPAARSSSKSSYNIPIWYYNEPILLFSLSKEDFYNTYLDE